MPRLFFVAFALVAALAAASVATAAPTYTFPLRWEASVNWWVQDAFMGMRKVHALAYVWTDYTKAGSVRMGQQRVDELYNYPETVGIPFGTLGLDADHHMQNNDANYYFYLNATGMNCYVLPNSGPMPPQHAFANESAYVGETTFEGRRAYLFKTMVDVIPGIRSEASLLLDVVTRKPLRVSFAGVPPYDMVGPNEMTYNSFSEVSAFPNVPLFVPPKECLKASFSAGSLSTLRHRPLA
jgi:hypothetical protein